MATKVYGTMGDWPNESRLSKLAIVRQCEESLRRLRTDRIDLYLMHHIDREASWDEIWEAMEQLKREGKILYVGSSNFAGWHIARANEIARARNFLGRRRAGLQPQRADRRAGGPARGSRVRRGSSHSLPSGGVIGASKVEEGRRPASTCR
jgi:aryl-alcohol dehydrogenase-like predicted oxidoreductase